MAYIYGILIYILIYVKGTEMAYIYGIILYILNYIG